MDQLLGQIVATNRSDSSRRILQVAIPTLTLLTNPVVRSLLFYMVAVLFFNVPLFSFSNVNNSSFTSSSSLDNNSSIMMEDLKSKRLSEISLDKVVIYGTMGYVGMSYYKLIDPLVACCLYFVVPHTWFIVYYVAINGIYFDDPLRNTLYAILLIVSCYQVRYHLIHLYKTLDQVDRERRSMNNIELLITALGNQRIARVANNISRMNLSQLKKYKEYLENELEKVVNLLPSLTNQGNDSQAEQHESKAISTVEEDYNLASENCVICRDNPCEYRCIPCHHVCFCSQCVSEFAEKLEDEEVIDDQEDNSGFFTQKPEIFSFDKILVNNSCPICRLQVQKLEYYKPMKNYVMERVLITKDQFHSDGLLRAYNEIFKLGLYSRERPELFNNLTHRVNFE